MAEVLNEGARSLGEKFLEKLNDKKDIVLIDASSQKRTNNKGRTDILTTIRVAPQYESANFRAHAPELLEGFNLLPRYDRGYEEGRAFETNEQHGRTIVSIQVFPFPGAAHELKGAKPKLREPEYHI